MCSQSRLSTTAEFLPPAAAVPTTACPPLPLPCPCSRPHGLLLQLKQFKKGIKNADTILKKFPDHGETLAMKVRAARGRDGGASVSAPRRTPPPPPPIGTVHYSTARWSSSAHCWWCS